MKKLFLLLLLVPGLLFAEANPNVIYILADDLGLGDLSIYGQKKFQTPNIDRIGNEGLKFTAHYSGNTVCSPSRAVLMTGQDSGKIYLRGNVNENETAPLDPKMVVLPEVFKHAGYATGAFGKWGLGWTHVAGSPNPLTHGFDEFCGWKSQSIAHTYYPTSYVLNGREIPLKKDTYVHDVIMDRALAFIETNAKNKKPFFCYIPTAVPHAAMHAPKELHEKWRKKFPQFDNVIGKYGVGRSNKTEKTPDVVNPVAGFAAMIENLDNQVGEILALLKKHGVDENTLIIFTSDNGAHREGGHRPDFWNSSGNLRGMKRDMHEGGIRTPMLARWPEKIKAGTSSDHISSFQDVLPTICELVDLPVPTQNDGLSFLPTLLGSGEQKAHDHLYFEFCKSDRQYVFSQAVRKGKWKAYRQLAKKKKGQESRMTAIEVYDLKNDPHEKKNLAKSNPGLVEEMEEIMKASRVPLPGQPEVGKLK